MARTVLGDIPSDRLGFFQPHEHLFVAAGPGTAKFPALLADQIDKSEAEVALFKKAGGDTLLDAQPRGAGGDYGALREISQKTGVNIIATCGFHMPFFYPEGDFMLTGDEQALYESFEKDLEIAGTVKVAIGNEGLTPDMLARFRAAARAAAKSGVPVVMHTEKGIGAVEAVSLLEKIGVSPDRVLVCHVDRQATDYAVHERIAKTGAVLEYDTIGRFKYHDDESEVKLIRHMLDKGAKIALSLDTTSLRMRCYSGGIGLDYIIKKFIPMLLESGVSKGEVDLMTRLTPASVFMTAPRNGSAD